jgi:hypothetical protein
VAEFDQRGVDLVVFKLLEAHVLGVRLGLAEELVNLLDHWSTGLLVWCLWWELSFVEAGFLELLWALWHNLLVSFGDLLKLAWSVLAALYAACLVLLVIWALNPVAWELLLPEEWVLGRVGFLSQGDAVGRIIELISIDLVDHLELLGGVFFAQVGEFATWVDWAGLHQVCWHSLSVLRESQVNIELDLLQIIACLFLVNPAVFKLAEITGLALKIFSKYARINGFRDLLSILAAKNGWVWLIIFRGLILGLA